MAYRLLWQWWMITTATSFRGYIVESKILHNEKQEEEVNHSKKRQQQRNLVAQNWFLTNETDLGHSCWWNYFLKFL